MEAQRKMPKGTRALLLGSLAFLLVILSRCWLWDRFLYPESTKVLLATLTSPGAHSTVQSGILLEIKERGACTLGDIEEAFEGTKTHESLRLAQAIAAIEPPQVELVLSKVVDTGLSKRVQHGYIRSLAYLDPRVLSEHPATFSAFDRILRDPLPETRIVGLWSASRLAPNAMRFTDYLRIGLGDPDPLVRRAASEELAYVPPGSLALCLMALADVDPDVRESASAAIASIASRNPAEVKEIEDKLTPMANDSNPGVRRNIQRALTDCCAH